MAFVRDSLQLSHNDKCNSELSAKLSQNDKCNSESSAKNREVSGPKVTKLFTLNSTEQDISVGQTKILKNNHFMLFKLSDAVFIMLINIKMPTTVDILIFISMINLLLS